LYEFVQKLAEKKRNQVGNSTRDQYGLQLSGRRPPRPRSSAWPGQTRESAALLSAHGQSALAQPPRRGRSGASSRNYVSSHTRISWTVSCRAGTTKSHPQSAITRWEVRALRSELDGARLALERTRAVPDVGAPRQQPTVPRRQRQAIAGGGCATPSWSTRRGARCSIGDLDKERELAGAEGNTGGFMLEDRCAALTREMTELKELAREATEGATEHAEKARETLAWAVNEAVRVTREGGVEARGDTGARAEGHGGKGADGVNQDNRGQRGRGGRSEDSDAAPREHRGRRWPARSTTKVVPLGSHDSLHRGQATHRRMGRFAILTSSIVFQTMMKEIATKTTKPLGRFPSILL
jgi:hypothetical protein